MKYSIFISADWVFFVLLSFWVRLRSLVGADISDLLYSFVQLESVRGLVVFTQKVSDLANYYFLNVNFGFFSFLLV